MEHNGHMENEKRHISHNNALEIGFGVTAAVGATAGLVGGIMYCTQNPSQVYSIADTIARDVMYTTSGGLIGGITGSAIAATGITIYEGVKSVTENIKENSEKKKALKEFREVIKPAIEKDMREMII